MTENTNLEIKNLFKIALENQKKNNFDQAEIYYNKILKLDSNQFETIFFLGTLYAQTKKFEKAIELLNKGIQINPKVADLYNNMGLIYKEKKEFNQSLKYFKKAVEVNENFSIAFSNLALVFKDLKNFEDSEKNFLIAIEKDPNNLDFYNNLGVLYKDFSFYEKAENTFKKILSDNPNNLLANLNLGNVFKFQEKIDLAEYHYNQCIKINSSYFPAYNNLMELLEITNQNEKFKIIIQKAKELSLNSKIVNLFWGQYLYKTKKYNESIECLKDINFEEDEINRERLKCLILGKAHDKLQITDKAFDYFSKVNQIYLKYKSNNIDKNNFLKPIKEKNIFFTKNKKFNTKNFSKNTSDISPIFLIGFPRSGTTLLDTILRSLPKIVVIEEKPILNLFLKKLNEKINFDYQNLNNLSSEDIINLKNLYYENLNKYIFEKDESKIYIDKMPLNIVYIAEIHKIFPDAKFLLAIRHPLDCVLSSFMQSFKLNDAMANFLNLEDAAIAYNEIMNLWFNYNSNHSVNYHIIKYEDVVTNFNESIKNVLDFLNVPWSDDILNFHKTAIKRKIISTPSYDQVNKPIYHDSINRWKNYEKEISIISSILKPWIKKFDY